MPQAPAPFGKKAQYMTLDAFIASMIVAITLVIVLTARSSQPYTAQSELISKGFSESLSQARLGELNNAYVTNSTRAGNITNLDNTVLQQAVEFYFTARKDQSFELLKNVTQGLITPRFSFKILINNEMIYNRTLSNENASSVLVTSKKIVFGVVNRTAMVYGPTITEVVVWQ